MAFPLETPASSGSLACAEGSSCEGSPTSPRARVCKPGRYAAIDIGTVTCRMLVADVDEAGDIEQLACEYEITNLGEGVDATGLLKPEAIERVMTALRRFLAVRDSLSTPESPVLATVAMATSASRDARNAGEFVDALHSIGISLAVIPGEKEAALSFSGAACDFADETLMVVDIGGGSTEVVIGKAAEDPCWSHSFNVGCRRLTERFVKSDPPSEEDLERASRWVREQMEDLIRQARRKAGSYKLVAVAGTATTVVTVRDAIGVYDSSLVHKQRVAREELDRQFEILRKMPLDQRQRVVGLDPKRASVIVAGLLIMQVVMDLANVDEFVVSETDILHGMVLDAANASGLC